MLTQKLVGGVVRGKLFFFWVAVALCPPVAPPLNVPILMRKMLLKTHLECILVNWLREGSVQTQRCFLFLLSAHLHCCSAAFEPSVHETLLCGHLRRDGSLSTSKWQVIAEQPLLKVDLLRSSHRQRDDKAAWTSTETDSSPEASPSGD